MRVGWVSALLCFTSAAGAAELRELRLWDSPEGTRVIFDLQGVPDHHVFTLDNPRRVVIDLRDVPAQAAAVANRASGRGAVQRVRSAPRAEGGVRVVLDLGQDVEPRAFLLDPAADYGHRLVLDLQDAGSKTMAPDVTPAEPQLVAPVAPAQTEPVMRRKHKPIVIAIDAGHGGEDPGAIGRGGLREKDVALAISRKLADLLNAQPSLKAVLIRDGDYYLPLRQRVNKARAAQADLFVSIHANAIHKREVRGSSIYVLSPRGVSSEHARWLAQKENAADLVGGIDIHGKDNELAAVLIDLSQASTLEASFDVGQRLLGSLGRSDTLQYPQVQQAGFAVLRAPDIPSVLVETAFISNAQDEKLLGSEVGQDRIAASLVDGIRSYFDNYRPQREIEETPRLQKVRASRN